MKRKLLFASALLMYGTGVTQIAPTAAGQGTNSIEYWSRSGNNQGGSNNNVFGTKWNSPIYTVTGGISSSNVRMKVNGFFTSPIDQYSINNYGWNQFVNTTGYLGLGTNTAIGSGQYLWSDKGAFSLLHLNGKNGTIVQEFGYRPWMQTGITFTDNNDLSYFGLRQIGTGNDITETTISWSDNNSGASGPDDMVFRFTGAGNGNTNISTNLNSTDDLDGFHIARFAPTGEFALGNTFGINAPGTPAGLYVRPQSLMHLSLDNNKQVWSQYTNQSTGQTQTDGLRMGIAPSGAFINGYLRWQENTPFIVQSAFSGNGASAGSGERMRVTSIGALNNTEGNFGGLTTPVNRTRVAFSADGANPITKPLSLLHLGYNTVAVAAGTDGWRNWMDIGIFTTNGTDNVYLGLKDEGGLLGDRQDAVLSWGDNQISGVPSGNGPDNFRMIFTSTTSGTGGGTAPATGTNGLEGMRLTPSLSNGIYTGIGGDPTVNLYTGNSTNPTATLEVNSWGATTNLGGSSGLRFTNLNTSSPTTANPGSGVLSVNDNGDVVYVQDGGGSAVGNYCNVPTNNLTGNYQIPLDNNNYYFVGGDTTNTDNNVGFGWPCDQPLIAKVDVYQIGTGGIAGSFVVNETFVSGNNAINPTGVRAYAQGNGSNQASFTGLHARSDAFNTMFNYGVYAEAMNSDRANIAGYFKTNGPPAITGTNIAVAGYASPIVSPSTLPLEANIGIYGNAARNPTGLVNRFAGFFEGDVWINGDVSGAAFFTIPSDSNFKNNIQQQQNANVILNQLKPKTFYFDTLNINELAFSSVLQHGLIAQDVETILPELVHNKVKPAMVDSLGNIVTPGVAYKSLDYSSLISILIAGHQEQGLIIDSLQSSNDSLHAQVDEINNRLTQLESCLSGILPFLCQLSQQAIQTNTPETQQAIRSQLAVYLENKETIILDQNVPNPFAEQTVINFSIPESVKNAQILFYNGLGALINTVEIKERGLGSLVVFGSDLSSGTYMYTLIADGIIVSTKKMVKQ